jgi:hypothetical protein
VTKTAGAPGEITQAVTEPACDQGCLTMAMAAIAREQRITHLAGRSQITADPAGKAPGAWVAS